MSSFAVLLNRRQPVVGDGQQRDLISRAVEHERRLVELNPIRPFLGQPYRHFFVDRQQPVEKLGKIRSSASRFRKQQETDRADQGDLRLPAFEPVLQQVR